jgi:TonB family protein
MPSETNGLYIMQPALAAAGGKFPSELRGKLLNSIEPKFTMLFFGLLFVIGTTVLLLSLRKVPDTMSDKQILKIQERYASIVLNQPKPKPVEQKVEEQQVKKATETSAEKKEEKIDREKETFQEKQARKEEKKVERQAVREKVKQQVQSAGIFAAITAVGGGNGGGRASASVTDLLGAASDGLGDISTMKVGKGSFATRDAEVAEVKARRGQITTGVDIAREDVGKAAVNRIASGGSVNITSAPPQISGESAKLASRSQSSIQRVIDTEVRRIKRMYENWLKRDPSLSGQLKIRFTILPSGEVANVSIISSTMNSSEFDSNVLRYVERWMFPNDSSAGPVEVEFPFVFEAQS